MGASAEVFPSRIPKGTREVKVIPALVRLRVDTKRKDQDRAASAAKKMSKSNTRDHLPPVAQKKATKQREYSSHLTGNNTSRLDKWVSEEQKKIRIQDSGCVFQRLVCKYSVPRK